MSWCGGGEISATPGLGVPQPRDLGGHLVARQLPALARLGALGDLDLQLVRERGVLGRDAEAPRRDLLDARVALVAEARRVLAALAAVRAAAEPVERDRDRLVRLCRERAVRHAAARRSGGRSTPTGSTSSSGTGAAGRDELEQVAKLERGATVDERREALVPAPRRTSFTVGGACAADAPAAASTTSGSSRAARRPSGT